MQLSGYGWVYFEFQFCQQQTRMGFHFYPKPTCGFFYGFCNGFISLPTVLPAPIMHILVKFLQIKRPVNLRQPTSVGSYSVPQSWLLHCSSNSWYLVKFNSCASFIKDYLLAGEKLTIACWNGICMICMIKEFQLFPKIQSQFPVWYWEKERGFLKLSNEFIIVVRLF